jgi:ABC transporter substrate binding protein (PQQ-dependent alcohol dehydrogenase system)
MNVRQRLRVSRRVIHALIATMLCAGFTLANPIVIGVIVPDAEEATDELTAAVARAAEHGAAMAEEEHAFNAELFGLDFAVVLERASGAEAVVAAAARLVDEEEALAVAGGTTFAEASALAAWSAERGIPYFNTGSPDDRLRNDLCEPTSFHIEASAAMYVDALAGWYVRSGFRNWFFVIGDDQASSDQYERTLWSLRERHFGAREAGRVGFDGDVEAVVTAVQRANTDLVLLYVRPEDQVRLLGALDDAGVEVLVAGFPYPAAQTRTFFTATRAAAPRLGVDQRATAWEATLDAYGAREINARYLMMFDEPMEPTAWATYMAVKVVFEAATLGGDASPEGVMAYIAGPQGVFDIWKGIGVSFRSWDHQLRQSLYLIDISDERDDPFSMVSLVGELPAIYMPGTDPVERLDQLGDLRDRTRCAL